MIRSRTQSCRPVSPGRDAVAILIKFGAAQEEVEPHTLRDIPRLAGAALMTALRRPATLLLPTSAVLYCLRCAGEVVTAALAASNSAISRAAGAPAASYSFLPNPAQTRARACKRSQKRGGQEHCLHADIPGLDVAVDHLLLMSLCVEAARKL